jgi:hypothetical protein
MDWSRVQQQRSPSRCSLHHLPHHMAFVSGLRVVDCLQGGRRPCCHVSAHRCPIPANSSKLKPAGTSYSSPSSTTQHGRPPFNLADDVLDVSKALHFISFADSYIFVSTIVSTCPYLVHYLSMSSIIYLFMIILSLPTCAVPSPPV